MADDQTNEPLDPAFVFDGAEPQTFWDNYAYFQSENQRKRQEFLDQLADDAAAWLEAEQASQDATS